MHPATSASARVFTPSTGNTPTTDSTSEAQAFALLEATSAANLAAFYVRRGNLAAARRKAVILLKSLQAFELAQCIAAIEAQPTPHGQPGTADGG